MCVLFDYPAMLACRAGQHRWTFDQDDWGRTTAECRNRDATSHMPPSTL
jgi:hypothetical protein